jgi:hypothetical protein
MDGDTPEIISEKLYGIPDYHWILMLLNQRYDYVNDFPLSIRELEIMIANKYGVAANYIRHFEDELGNTTNGYCYLKLSKKVKGTILSNHFQSQVFGTNTAFKEQLAVGNKLRTADGTLIGTIKTIKSNIELELDFMSELPTYIGNFICEIPINVGDIVRNKTAIGVSVGVVQDILDDKFGLLMLSNTFISGGTVQVLTYSDDDSGNYIETSKGTIQISSLAYPGLLKHITNTDYEYRLNEESRTLKILPKIYLSQVLSEFNSLLLR